MRDVAAGESMTDAIKAVATGHARARPTAAPVRAKPSLTDAMKDVASRGGRKPPATRAGRKGIVIYVEPEVADAIRRLALERVEYRRTIPSKRAFVGETLDVTYSVINRKALPVPWLEIRAMR